MLLLGPEPGGEVVALFPDADLEDDDSPLKRTPPETPCSHRKVELDTEKHKVICRECRREVDPFAFLVYLVGDWELWVRHRKLAHARATAAQTRLDETLRLEQNARARLKRLDPETKPPPVPWGEGRGAGR